ncbi:NAD+ synthase [Acidipila sp. EB88]|uniref:NAD+ synthase n=1 Tax=Acidipila sp. EB88 TaxID=2305226 RepID=UPI000F5E4D0E|nr:NAD+ synthase [Acidipila sp. EB88]RRA47211.1 NAD+ synthase [Acidipila sp. EB88]
MKIALAQINPTVGDFSGNLTTMLRFVERAAHADAELVIFPELSICGYPPADLLEKPAFVERAQQVLEELAQGAAAFGITVLCGYPSPAPLSTGKHVYNSAAVLSEGTVAFVQSKRLLPFYDVFDEQRYFAPATAQQVFEIAGERVAITICEDAWNDKSFWETRRYQVDPIEELMRSGGVPQGSEPPSLILNISASPYWRGKHATREAMLAAIARRYERPVVMVNQVGGNDSLLFDGTSLALNRRGEVAARALSCVEDMVFFDTATETGMIRPAIDDEDGLVVEALAMGVRDYIRKCGFRQVLIGLSGGIDSALVAAIAVQALGAENVIGIGMPSDYSSTGSIDDSRELARNLGIRFELVPIAPMFASFTTALAPLFDGAAADLTEENLQSRIRGTLLMAASNKWNALVLTTGNKSEMATGYCTLYGDMVGALAVIGDVMKTEVYRLCRFINRERAIIPEAILTKPPSAELRPGQLDSDSLPDYEHLDPVLAAYVEHYETADEIAEATALDRKEVARVLKLVERSEYKRQQAAPVLKVTEKAFGMGRRFPIAAKAQV